MSHTTTTPVEKDTGTTLELLQKARISPLRLLFLSADMLKRRVLLPHSRRSRALPYSDDRDTPAGYHRNSSQTCSIPARRVAARAGSQSPANESSREHLLRRPLTAAPMRSPHRHPSTQLPIGLLNFAPISRHVYESPIVPTFTPFAIRPLLCSSASKRKWQLR